MAKLTGYACDSKGKREGIKFGANTVRMIRRKRARLEAKQDKRVSSHRDQSARGFA